MNDETKDLREMFALLHNQCFTFSIIHGKSFPMIIHESVDGGFH